MTAPIRGEQGLRRPVPTPAAIAGLVIAAIVVALYFGELIGGGW